MPVWLPSALKGLGLGLAVSGLNYLIMSRTFRRGEKIFGQRGKYLFLVSFLGRIALDFAAMLLVYKDVPMLIATVVGLTADKNILVIRQFSALIKRKGMK